MSVFSDQRNVNKQMNSDWVHDKLQGKVCGNKNNLGFMAQIHQK